MIVLRDTTQDICNTAQNPLTRMGIDFSTGGSGTVAATATDLANKCAAYQAQQAAIAQQAQIAAAEAQAIATGAATDWTKYALVGGGLLAAAFVAFKVFAK